MEFIVKLIGLIVSIILVCAIIGLLVYIFEIASDFIDKVLKEIGKKLWGDRNEN